MAVVQFLIEHPNCALEGVLRDLSPRFPGLLAPSLGLVGEVLVSYAEQVEGQWKLRAEDRPSARKAELSQMADLLQVIGERLEFRTNRLDERRLVWEAGETSAYAFHLKASAIMDEAVTRSAYPRERTLVVIPGGRASLLAYKISRDPALAARLHGIRFIKFRLARALAEMAALNRDAFEEQIQSDAFERARGQWMMF